MWKRVLTLITWGGNKGRLWGLLSTVHIPLNLPSCAHQKDALLSLQPPELHRHLHSQTHLHTLGLGDAPMIEHLLRLHPSYLALPLWSSTWNAQGTISVLKRIWLLLWQTQKRVNHSFRGNASDMEFGFNFSHSVSPVQISTRGSKSVSILFLHVCFAGK